MHSNYRFEDTGYQTIGIYLIIILDCVQYFVNIHNLKSGKFQILEIVSLMNVPIINLWIYRLLLQTLTSTIILINVDDDYEVLIRN